MPGIPDTYQGAEFWDFSLVDPDNRRPVDFSARKIALAQHLSLDLLAESWRDGRIKQAVLRKLLRFRQSASALFSRGSYEPLAVQGSRAGNVLAFLRREGDAAMLVVAARSCAEGMTASDALVPDQVWWADTRIVLPEGFRPADAVLGPDLSADGLSLATALPVVPVGVWALQRA